MRTRSRLAALAAAAPAQAPAAATTLTPGIPGDSGSAFDPRLIPVGLP